MTKVTTKEKPEEEVVKLTGTFFDTFEFKSDSIKLEDKTTVKTPEAIKAEEDAEIARLAEEEKNKGKTPEEILAEQEEADRLAEEAKNKPPEQTPEEIKKQIQATVEALKEKKEEELEDDEKQFLEDFEAGALKDYKPEVKPEDKTEEKTGFDTLTKNLIKEGVLAEMEEDEITDEQETLSLGISKTIEKGVDSYLNEIPEDYRNWVDHMRTGGTLEDYMRSKQKTDFTSLDYTNSQTQETLVRAKLAQEGYNKDDIDEKITDLKDLEKMEKEAKIAGNYFDKDQDKRLEAYDKKIEDAVKALDASDVKYVDDTMKAIDDAKELVGFKLTTKRKDAFKKYLFEVDANGETAASRADNTIERRLKLLFMDFINYDFSDMQRSVETKTTRDLSNILNRYKDTNVVKKGITVKDKDPEPEEAPLVFPSMFTPRSED